MRTRGLARPAGRRRGSSRSSAGTTRRSVARRHHPESRASSPTTRSWRRCRSCSCWCRSSGWSPSRTRSTSSCSDDADNAIPIELRQILRSALTSATANTGQAVLFLAIGLLTALYVSANVMGSLVGGLDRARGVPHRPWARGKLVALVIAIATSVLVVATTLALVGGSRLVESVAEELFGRGAPERRRPLPLPDRHRQPADLHPGRVPLRPERAPAADHPRPARARWSAWASGSASRACSPSTSRTSTTTRRSTGRWRAPRST